MDGDKSVKAMDDIISVKAMDDDLPVKAVDDDRSVKAADDDRSVKVVDDDPSVKAMFDDQSVIASLIRPVAHLPARSRNIQYVPKRNYANRNSGKHLSRNSPRNRKPEVSEGWIHADDNSTWYAVDRTKMDKGKVKTSRIDKYDRIEYLGVPNSVATSIVLTMAGLTLAISLVFVFIMAIVRAYFKDQDEELQDRPEIKIAKGSSPYIVTPEQKLTDQIVSSKKFKRVECCASDIAHLVYFLSKYYPFDDGGIESYPSSRVVLVPRTITKFDEGSVQWTSPNYTKQILRPETMPQISEAIKENEMARTRRTQLITSTSTTHQSLKVDAATSGQGQKTGAERQMTDLSTGGTAKNTGPLEPIKDAAFNVPQSNLKEKPKSSEKKAREPAHKSGRSIKVAGGLIRMPKEYKKRKLSSKYSRKPKKRDEQKSSRKQAKLPNKKASKKKKTRKHRNRGRRKNENESRK